MRLLTSPLIYLARHILTKQFALLSDRMTTFQQAQAEGLCLRFPNNLGIHREVNYEHAVEMLIRAVPTSQNTPFVWGFIDKPAGPSRRLISICNLIPTHITDGQILLLFLSTQVPFPNDGIRYQDAEVKYAMPVGTTRVSGSSTPFSDRCISHLCD